jgi:hypothetical protein
MTEQADHDCSKVENLESPSQYEPADAETIIQTFKCAVCGNTVVETFKLESREVEPE